MAHNAQIDRAIAHLKAQNEPNIAAVAREFNVKRETLSKRFRGVTTSRADSVSNTKKKLSTAQEEVLVAHINKLSDRGLPPTPRMVQNLARELSKSSVGVNWVSRFCKRYHHQLRSLYLRTIDHKRKIADNSLYFEHYFKLVGHLLKLWWCCYYFDTEICLHQQLSQKIEKYNIEPQNIFNFDEKNFLINLLRSLKRIVSSEVIKLKQLLGVS
jgi:transposase-like protein